MSRAMNLTISQAEVISACAALNVATTSIETLVPNGTRVVCQTSEGSRALRAKMKGKLIDGSVARVPLALRTHR